MEFEKVYASVKGIVNKARKEFYIKLWDRDDWEQEGMMTLFELLEAQPWLVDEQVQLYCYFKVKFRNRIKDRIRKQESQKRKFDRMPHEDIHEQWGWSFGQIVRIASMQGHPFGGYSFRCTETRPPLGVTWVRRGAAGWVAGGSVHGSPPNFGRR